MSSKPRPRDSVDACGFSVEAASHLVETAVDEEVLGSRSSPRFREIRLLMHKFLKSVGFDGVVFVTYRTFSGHFVQGPTLCLDWHHDGGRC